MSSPKSPPMSRGARSRSVQMLVGLALGGLVGVGIASAAKAGLMPDPSSLTWSQAGGLLLAVMLAGAGLLVTAVSFSGPMTARAMDPDGNGMARPGQTGFYRRQGIILLLAGLMMGAPVVAQLMFDPVPHMLAAAILTGLVAMALIQTAFNLSIWTQADEMMRRMIAEAGAICFWVLQAIFFLWAAAEVLGLAPKLSSWDLMVALMAFYLVTSSVLSIRRGFA